MVIVKRYLIDKMLPNRYITSTCLRITVHAEEFTETLSLPVAALLSLDKYYFKDSEQQARNQLGTSGRANNFLREVQIFENMSNSFKLCS